MIKGLQIVDLDKTVAERAGKIQNSNKISIGDAIHLATALNSKCSEIFTNDEKLAKQANEFMKVVEPNASIR
jgi:predicted nucleic acid-binding protein